MPSLEVSSPTLSSGSTINPPPSTYALHSHYIMEKFSKTLKDMNITSSELEGHELREAVKVWQELAASETRIIMMRKMISDKIGFTDLEEMNQEIISKYKSSKFKGKAEGNENLRDTMRS